MANQRRFECSNCGHEFYEDEVQKNTRDQESQMKCPECGSSNMYELDFWGSRKHKNSNWLFDQMDENDSN